MNPRRLLLASSLASLLGRLLPARAATANQDPTLRAYIDTLIPADETPSGSALGVDVKLRDVAAGQPDYADLLARGTTWLEREAQARHRTAFAAITDDQRDTIVARIATADHRTLQRVFFERTRTDALFFYYGDPRSWRGIGHYRGPPQPAGFMDYAQAPRRAK